MKVIDLMTRHVHCVAIDHSLNEAAHIMWEHNCGSVPVVDADNHVVGMVTDRDIAMAAYINGKQLVDLPVSTVQSRQLICCKPDDDIKDVELKMQANPVHRIPVIGDHLEPLGIVSLNDIAIAYRKGVKAITSKDVSDTLSAICVTPSHVRAVQAVA